MSSTLPGVLESSDVHVALRLGDLAGEDDERVLAAVALAVRAVRHGSVCVDLATVPALAPDLPWPDPREWSAAVAGIAAARGRRGPARARPALPRPLPPARAPGLRRPARPDGPAAPRRRRGGARRGRRADQRRPHQRRAAGRGGPGRAPVDDRDHRRPRHRQDHHGRPDARAARRPGAPTGANGCRSRSAPRPARPPPASRRRSRPSCAISRRRTRTGSAGSRR